ncbi:MAG: 30S ribosomal protein S7 [bacterium]|jgi:small subunit ribosomal protein S7|nr:30S ribosomal protein S7 [bacterium]
MRKAKAKKRILLPDPKFNETLVTRFVNNMMWDGKKSVAFGIFYDAIDLVEKKISEEAGIDTWKKALSNVMPMVEVKARRVGGATFQIPTEIAPERRAAMGMKWLISYSRKRNEKSMAEKLAAEIVAASKGEGATVKKKDDTHKMAESNKAFAHFKA